MSETRYQNLIEKAEDYEAGKAGSISPGELEEGKKYTERRKLPTDKAAELGAFAIDRTVGIVSKSAEGSSYRIYTWKTDNGDISEHGPAENVVNDGGLIISDEQGSVGFEDQGYFLEAETLEEYRTQIEEIKKLQPVLCNRTMPSELKYMELPLPGTQDV